MSVVDFPTAKTRAACYACFDFATQEGGDHQCPTCGRPLGDRLASERRPPRPSMFQEPAQ